MPLIEAYLAANPEAQASYVWYLEAVSILARSVPLQEPPAALKSRVLDRIRGLQAGKVDPVESARSEPAQVGSARAAVPSMSSNRSRPRSFGVGWRRSRLPIAFGLTAALAISAIVGLGLRNNDLSRQLRTLEVSQRSLESLLNSSGTKTVALNSVDGKAGVGLALIGTDGRVLISHTLGKAVVGKTWQAWYILKGETAPRPLETTRNAQLLIRVPANTQVIALSEEPVGGSLVPTTIRAIATL